MSLCYMIVAHEIEADPAPINAILVLYAGFDFCKSAKSDVLIFSRPSRGLKIPFLKADLIFLRSVASPKDR